jgi:predicted lipid carrier protein YhbT
MTRPPHTLPAPVAALLGRLPRHPGSLLFARLLSIALGPHLPEDVGEAITGRTLRLRVNDAGLQFDFLWRSGGFHACPPSPLPDLTIGASLHDLVSLARREEDPDTLFFSRRLALEGDTELGLLFKNTIDSLDVSMADMAASLRPNLRPWRSRPPRPTRPDQPHASR